MSATLRYVLVPWLVILSSANPAHSVTQQRTPKSYVLAIGIDTYNDPFWHDLKYASNDAASIYQTLRESFDGGELLTTSSSGEISRDQILKQIGRMKAAAKDEQDVVVLYFSAHGTIGRRSSNDGVRFEKYLVTSTTRSDEIDETALSHQELLKAFEAIKSNRKVLILDTCYSGAGKSKLTPKILDIISRQKGRPVEPNLYQNESVAIFSASAWGEEALESSDLEKSVYTHYLINGMQQDLNRDGLVTITEAHTYATQQVVKHTDGAQHPTAKIEMVGEDPIIVTRLAAPQAILSSQPLLFAYDWLFRKVKVEVDGKPIGTMSKGALTVPQGTSRVKIYDQERQLLANRIVHFEQSKEYSISDLIWRSRNIRAATSIGVGTFDSGTRSQAMGGPRPLVGFQVSHQDILWGLDGGVQFQHGFSKSNSYTNEDRSINQSSSLYEAGISVGSHTPINFLSAKNRELTTTMTYGISPRFLWLRRQLDEGDIQDKNQQSQVGGLGLYSGIETLLADPSLLFGAQIFLGGYQSPFDRSKVMTYRQFSLSGGMAW